MKSKKVSKVVAARLNGLFGDDRRNLKRAMRFAADSSIPDRAKFFVLVLHKKQLLGWLPVPAKSQEEASIAAQCNLQIKHGMNFVRLLIVPLLGGPEVECASGIIAEEPLQQDGRDA